MLSLKEFILFVKKISMIFKPQKYKYDCWVAATFNMLRNSWINLDYHELEKMLQTTKLWWTFPKNIIEFLKNNFFDVDLKNGILLIDSHKFYNDNIDYGHYVNIAWIVDWKYKIFDPYDGQTHFLTKKEILNVSKNVLVWKTKRFDNIILGNTFDLV